MRRIKKYRKKIIFILDIIIIIFSCYIFQLLVPIEKAANDYNILDFLPNIIILLLSISLCQYLLKTYDNIWRYAEGNEYVRLMLGMIAGFIIYIMINHLIFIHKTSAIFSVATCSISIIFMLLMRFIYRIYLIKIKKNINQKITMAIIGAGGVGVRLMEEIQYNTNSNYEIYCFFDDNTEKIGKKIRGIKVLGPIDEFNDLIKNTPISEVIIAIPILPDIRKNEILKIVSKSNLRVKVLPDLLSILRNSKGDLLESASDFNVDDLLGRALVSFDKKEIDKFFNNKVIMVTGGGGSIGSELCRQIAQSKPAQLIIIDYYENNAYEIQQELIYDYKNKLNLVVEIASVQDKDKIEQLFERYHPQIVFHAAAHKHVPFMEISPDEAIKNNVLGTYNMVQAADKWNVQKFVLISTDKAVNPTSIMGASKRMCEMIIQSMKNISKTEYVAVRFGNVLGSNGSVIPLFKRQIEHGGPITITDKRVYRYFMTISEAAQLVLRAGSMESDSEIYVLDMGRPINILKLAEKLTRLLGHIPYTEIPIKEIGMRPGEKLNEELFMHEDLVKTENQKIYIEMQKSISFGEIEKKIDILNQALETKDINMIRESLISIIPNFKLAD
ncbi:polysaccharide biosynthesis protein [[Clostridium] fimetarium]|uniref:NDP-sugar epimerase, includes UDP-GlcNAc-inverting 4,6-dehydratase FlaA1 and capsular polysaccharide biosynthesis protein EpsC n=1 Tax=[Clostridium] fimetarium TaxID=99656 RepID=A0A1I0RGR0_9FIRM|nr:nucleoside-diphosphate sugar epimerase/dehydratase [[Clostridium] fimetarium]SEW39856.1 NDP-sugar epimerase, includes UDP-GlcNAc-inverting 4,6-dehydratase FlaA1 and capsular polysaccharide biosynthesis protein EpsC [[Clostridium] fimetarium]